MSGIIGSVGARSGIVGTTEINKYYCQVQLTSNMAIRDADAWRHPASSEIGAMDDPQGWWDDTNRKILPKKSGHYYVWSRGMIGNLPSNRIFGTLLAFSGTDFTGDIHDFGNSNTANDAFTTINAIVFFDGVDDTVLAKYHNSHDSNLNVVSGRYTQFGVIWIGE